MKSIFASIVLAFLLATPCFAQSRGIRTSLDGSVGLGIHGSSVEYRDRANMVADVFLVGAIAERSTHDVVVGIDGNATMNPTNASLCRLDASGNCMPRTPDVLSVAALAGVESVGGRFRASAGPGIASVGDSRDAATVLAFVARVDWWGRLAGPIGVICSFRTSYVPSYRGGDLRLASINVGIGVRQSRLQ